MLKQPLRVPPEAIVKHLQERVAPLLGVLLTGAPALRKDDSRCDLDLYAITLGHTIRRAVYRWTEMEIDVDLWTVTPDYVASRFKSSTPVVRSFAIGKVLLNTNDTLTNLVYEARIRYSVGPKAQTDSQVAQLRHRVAKVLDDCSRFLQVRTNEETDFFYVRVPSLALKHSLRASANVVRR
jgi:hypothetical protein